MKYSSSIFVILSSFLVFSQKDTCYWMGDLCSGVETTECGSIDKKGRRHGMWSESSSWGGNGRYSYHTTEYPMHKGRKHGLQVEYYSSTVTQRYRSKEQRFRKGIEHGRIRVWASNGQLLEKAHMRKGFYCRKRIIYDTSGVIRTSYHYFGKYKWTERNFVEGKLCSMREVDVKKHQSKQYYYDREGKEVTLVEHRKSWKI